MWIATFPSLFTAAPPACFIYLRVQNVFFFPPLPYCRKLCAKILLVEPEQDICFAFTPVSVNFGAKGNY